MGVTFSLIRETWAQFQRHRAPWLAAAMSYFTLFAIAPLIIVVVEIGGALLGHHRILLNEIYRYLGSTAGPGAAHAIQSIVTATFGQQHRGVLAQTIAWIVFVLATLGLFGALQEALNTAWDVEPGKRSIMAAIRARAISLAAIGLFVILLLVLVMADAGLTAANAALANVTPVLPALVKAASILVSTVVIWLACAFLFAFMPDCRIEWRDVWIGAAVTALLFVLGQSLLSWYLARAGTASTYAEFGSIVVFLLWLNYSAQIMLFGAEFTHVYAGRFGSHQPSANRAADQARTARATSAA